ncbi:hypothetical protein BCR44DRAFT_1431803 [Catenaria anguillulae PL171]|uniref:C2H2-type domain-containing protein n=1 Tax=Catenaria anguillulae PL171 TaxID=765915 RepID=A0A1Y2HQC3_9FUNG|nr:hypothetical protein BCR44DRAFT_1431803 [Catenaria anguillulae PL171]
MLSSPIESAGLSHGDMSAWIASTMHEQMATSGMLLHHDHGASSSSSSSASSSSGQVVGANVDVLDHFMHYTAAYPEVHVNGLGLVDESLVCLASPIVDHHQDQGLSSPLVAINMSASSTASVGAGAGDGAFAGAQPGVLPNHLLWHPQVHGSAGTAMASSSDPGCTYSLPSPVPSTRSSTGPADQQQQAIVKPSTLGYKGSPPPSDLWSLPLKSSLDLDVFSHGSVMSSAPTSPSMRMMTFAVDPEVIKQALLMQVGSNSGSDSSVGPSPLSASSSSPTMPAPSSEGGSECMDLQALFSNGGSNSAQVGGSAAADVDMNDSPPSPPATPMVVNPKQAHEDQQQQVQFQAPRYPNQAPMPMPAVSRPPLSVSSSTYSSTDLTSPVLPSPMTAAFLLAQQTPLPPTPTTPSGAFDGNAAASSGASLGASSSNLVSYPETLPAPTKLCPAPVRRPRMRKRSTLSGDDGMGGSSPVPHHHPYAQHGMVAISNAAVSTGLHTGPSSPVTPTISEHPASPTVASSPHLSALLASGTDETGNPTTSKLYTCIKCDKSFKRKADCVRHARVHTGEKPYRCPCGESFARQDALRRHQSKAPLETTCRMALLNGGVLPAAFSGDDGVHLSPGLTVVGGRPVTSLDRSPAALACVVALAPAPARE